VSTVTHPSRQTGKNTVRMNDLATLREVQAINVAVLDAYHEEHVLPLMARVEVLEARAARPWWRFWGR
jgi:hypothetical protein